MTSEQRALLLADQRRHLALAKSCQEVCLREQHEAIAEALGAAIEEGEVKPPGLNIYEILRPGDQIRFTLTDVGRAYAKDRPAAMMPPLSVPGTVIQITRAHGYYSLVYEVFGTIIRETFKI